MKKYCTKCGKPFEAVGREVICPSCKAQAAEEIKRAAVLRAKRASWSGESVPVRISGRASTVIREYGAASNLPFASALDELLKASSFFQAMGKAWTDITPYKSHRRDRAASTQDAQEAPHDEQGVPHDVTQVTQVTQVAKKATKASTASKPRRAVAEFGGFGVVIDGVDDAEPAASKKASTAKKAAKTASAKKG